MTSFGGGGGGGGGAGGFTFRKPFKLSSFRNANKIHGSQSIHDCVLHTPFDKRDSWKQ